MSVYEYVSKSDLEEIQRVVGEVEATCPGEIIPVFAAQSSYYESGLWRGALLFTVVYCFVMSFWHHLISAVDLPLVMHLMAVLIAGVLGACLAIWFPRWKRYLVGPNTMKNRVFDAATKMFVKHGIFNTNNRTGILIYISFFEHLAVIETDVGVADQIPNEKWNKVVSHLVSGLGKGKNKDAVCNAIKECGNILMDSEIPWDPEKTNELPNEPIVEI